MIIIGRCNYGAFMLVSDFVKLIELNGGCNREFGDWQIIDVHEIPEVFTQASEVDFYCYNKKSVYLLRLRNRISEMLYIIPENEYGHPIYLIAELPFANVDNELLESILAKFNMQFQYNAWLPPCTVLTVLHK